MAGPDPTGAFDPDDYREQIRAVMLMGLPEDVTLRPTFYFADTVVNEAADPGNRPWDFTQPKTSTVTVTPVRVVCGIEVDPGSKGYTAVGKFEARTATLSFFEDEWDDVDGFIRVLIGGKPYKRGATLEPAGLFEVTTQYVEVIAEDM